MTKKIGLLVLALLLVIGFGWIQIQYEDYQKNHQAFLKQEAFDAALNDSNITVPAREQADEQAAEQAEQQKRAEQALDDLKIADAQADEQAAEQAEQQKRAEQAVDDLKIADAQADEQAAEQQNVKNT